MKLAAAVMNNMKKTLQGFFFVWVFFDVVLGVLFFSSFIFVWFFFPFAFGEWLAIRERIVVASEASRAKAPSVAAAACAARLIAVQTIRLQ